MEKVKALLYCTKSKPYLTMETDFVSNKKFYLLDKDYGCLNGKIIAECEVETEKIECRFEDDDFGGDYIYSLEKSEDVDFGIESCLDFDRLNEYLKGENGYALHISNLNVFDKPKELDDFTTRTPVDYDSIVCDSCTELNCDCKKCRYSYDYQQVIKAPKNMMKVCEWDIEDKILISIQPEWICKILNGEKTIEVRRKVLKGMMK